MMPKAKILLVEDDANMGFLVKDYFEMQQYQVTLIKQGNEAMPTFIENNFHICILDVMLPQKDGFSIATEIRQYDPHIPIIFLTAKNMKDDCLKGFQLGADDYVTKPFSIQELHLRIEAVLKRSHAVPTREEEKKHIKLGNMIFDIVNQRLKYNDTYTELTYRETKLLKLFCMHKNQTLERNFILKVVWEDEGIIIGRSIDVFVSRLRKLFKDNTAIKIVNVHSVGYRFDIAE